MGRRVATALVLGLAHLTAGTAGAATCTVSDLRVVVRSLDLEGAVPVGGLALPVAIDEASGAFSLDLTDFPSTTFNIVVDNQLDFEPKVYVGTIDGAGNVYLPAVQMNLTTTFGGGSAVVAVPDLSTGIATVSVTGRDFATEGEPLDFSSRRLVLEGQVVLTGPPGSPGAVTAGVHLDCTVSPLPDRSKLPAGPRLLAGAGRGKLAKPGGKKLVGDTLTKLAARFVPGAGGAEMHGGLFFRLRGATGDDVVLVSAAVQGAGKKLTMTDTDANGSTIRVVKGRKRTATESAPLDGKVVLRETTKGPALRLREEGLDLSALAAGPGTLTVQVGQAAASRAVTVARRGRAVSFR